MSSSFRVRLCWLTLFAVAMAAVEAAVVVYLRELYYPEGFSFPLKLMPPGILAVEVGREAATLVMLVSAAYLAGARFWERAGYFAFLFGVWDIGYYVWLRIMIGWPATLLDWDILFLIPIPWLGPVIAPVLLALLMIVTGALVARRAAAVRPIVLDRFDWLLGVLATAAIVYSFLHDTGAGLRFEMPRPYPYFLLIAGMILYAVAAVRIIRRSY